MHSQIRASSPAPTPADDDIAQARFRRQKAPEDNGSPMANNSPPALQNGPAFMWPSSNGKHCGKPPPFSGQTCMSDGVDAPMHVMEPRGRHAAMDCLFGQPQTTKLID